MSTSTDMEIKEPSAPVAHRVSQPATPLVPTFGTPTVVTANNPSLHNGSVSTPVGGTCCDEGDYEQELDAARGRCFIASVTHLVLGLINVPFVWIGYGFTAILAILMITFGVIGVIHLHSINSLRYSTCCCFPLNTIKQLHTCLVVTGIFAVLAMCCDVLQVIMEDEHERTARIFAVVGSVLSLLSLISLVLGAKWISSLRCRCQHDEVMVNGPFAAPNPPTGTTSVNAVAPHQCMSVYSAPLPAYYGHAAYHYGAHPPPPPYHGHPAHPQSPCIPPPGSPVYAQPVVHYQAHPGMAPYTVTVHAGHAGPAYIAQPHHYGTPVYTPGQSFDNYGAHPDVSGSRSGSETGNRRPKATEAPPPPTPAEPTTKKAAKAAKKKKTEGRDV
jgi:hypothetical protein